MPRFEITGKGKDSGRKRKRTYSAINVNEARLAAEKDGMLVEQIHELPPDPPTERQLEFARELDIAIPADVTRAELSDLISIKLDRDKPATERHREFARSFGVEATQYVGKKSLFNKIQAALIEPGRERELLSWFVYRVYRQLIGGKDDAPIQSHLDPLIQEIAEKLAADDKMVKSVRRYEGRELIWFGEWTAPDGIVYTGGSNRTAAYKEAAALLKQKLNLGGEPLPQRSASATPSVNREVPKPASKGCLSIVLLAVCVPLMFWMLWR